MSDAMTDAYRMERQGNAEDAYLDALINFLYDSSPANKSTLEVCMKKFGDLIRGYNGLRILEEQCNKLESNDRATWKEVEMDAASLFKRRPNLRKLFLESAEKRKIGSLQWVI